jgi:hypothetical protein
MKESENENTILESVGSPGAAMVRYRGMGTVHRCGGNAEHRYTQRTGDQRHGKFVLTSCWLAA